MNHNDRVIHNEGGNYSGNMAEQEYDRWLDETKKDPEDAELDAYYNELCREAAKRELVRKDRLTLK